MDATLLLGLYRQMALCRRFEEAAAKAYSQGKVSGFLHLYVGQEAVAVGARGYPKESEIVNGDDVLEVREAVRHAVNRARRESLPIFIEAKTYRFRGHSVADPATYRSKEELRKWMERDPIRVLADRIQTLGIATEEQLGALDDEVKAQVQDAVEFAERTPAPEPDTVGEHVYA